MKKYLCGIFVLCLCTSSALADPPTVEQLLATAHTQSENHQYDDALKTLAEAQKQEPDNLDVMLAVAWVHAWQGKYIEAEQEVGVMTAINHDNADIRTLSAYLDYYQGRAQQAIDKFTVILKTYPNNTDAADGLKLAQVQQAEQAADKAAAAFLWQFDTGYEHSFFARQPPSDWSNEFAQITRFFDGGETAVHGRFEYYDEFNTTDAYYEIGVDHRFLPWLTAYLYGGHTADASFRPSWRIEPGGAIRVQEEDKKLPAVWLTLDIKEDNYNTIDVASIDPGVRFEYCDWSFNTNLVQVEQWGLTSVWGWNARLDGPLFDSWRFYAGYTNAPDTENAVTAYTATMYGGLSYAFDDAHVIAFGYTHDDRQNSYIRHVFDIAFTYRL